MYRFCFVLLLTLPMSLTTLAQEGASGQFQIHGEEERTVADGIAWLDDGVLRLVFSDRPFDRVEMAADGELDAFDFMGEGATMTVQVDDDGDVASVSLHENGMTHYFTGRGEAVEFTRRDERRVAGTFAVGDASGLRFDLPINDGRMERPGETLPADGGEPGRILLSRIAAIHAGDMEELIANTPPDQADEMRAAVADGEGEQLLAMAQMFTPKDIQIQGGSQDGDTAWVDFTGNEGGSAVKGVGILKRSDGRWAVESVNTRQSSD